MALGKTTLFKILALVIGCAANFTTGSLFVFNVYQDAIKDTFNYTQKEVELLSSMLNLGFGVGFLPGMFYDKFGAQWASVAGLLLSVPAYLLIWSSSKSVHFYSANSWLVALYFFICGLGSLFTYIVALNTNIINFDEKHTGKIVGLLNGFFAGSPSVFVVIYYHLFARGDTTDTTNQDFPGFILFLAISVAIVDILCVVLLKVCKDDSIMFTSFENEVETDAHRNVNHSVPTADSGGNHGTLCSAGKTGIENVMGDINGDISESSVVTNDLDERNTSVNETGVISESNAVTAHLDEMNKSVNETVVTSESNAVTDHLDEMNKSVNETGVISESNALTDHLDEMNKSVKEIMLNIDYQLLIWLVAFASAIGLVYVNNITVISKSLRLNQYDDRLTLIIPITNAILSAPVGILSDAFKERLPRMWFLAFGSICFTASQILVFIFAQELSILVISAILAGVGVAILWSLAPTVMKELFGVSNLGRNWGIAILLAALIGFGIQEAYGAIYDVELNGGDGVHCYGMKCIRGGTTICLASGAVSIALGVVMISKKRCLVRRN